MRSFAIPSLCLLVSGCAFPAQVQRFGVEYNSALETMNNEQTLLNILRARDGMPTHFTSVSQFRGTINLTAGASFNGQFKGSGVTDTVTSGATSSTASTVSSTTNLAAPGALPATSAVATTVTTPATSSSVSSVLAEGVDLYTPQVSGQVASGTAFDVSVFDTQKFYNGITASVPFTTVETLFSQSIDNRLIVLLMIARVDFRLKENVGSHISGDIALSVINDPANKTLSAEFLDFAKCYALSTGVEPAEEHRISAMSRITRGPDDKVIPLALEKLLLLDGEKFSLSGELGSKAEGDANIYLNRLTAPKRLPRLSRRGFAECSGTGDQVTYTLESGRKVSVPKAPPAKPLYLGDGELLIFDDVAKTIKQADVEMEITFRSPEGLFRYLGTYLQGDNRKNLNLNGDLFSIANEKSKYPLAQATYRGERYSLVNDEATGMRNAQVFTLLQQLINLHKEAAERPTAIPVRAIP